MKATGVFANLSLAAKFFIAPAVVVVCLVGVSITAYLGVAQQKAAIESMHHEKFAMYRSSADLLIELTRVHEGMFKVMTWSQVGYSDDRIAGVVSEQANRLESVRNRVADVLGRSYLLPEERAAYSSLDKPLADYAMWSKRVMDMANSDIATAAVYMGTAELKYQALQKVLLGIEELETKASDHYFTGAIAAYRRTLLGLFVGFGVSIAIALGVTVFATRLISKPVHRVVAELGAITEGEWNLTRRIPVETRDEISLMTKGINSFVEKLQSLIEKISKSTATLTRASGELSGVSESLSANTRDTSDVTNNTAQSTQKASRNIRNITEAAEAMSSGVSSASASIDQISASLRNVVKQCKDETDLSSAANAQADATKELMAKLGHSSREIGKIVDLIKNIATQTNLLALNANIEAASAGAAGTGFAVVAREVKELALKTSQATSQIGSQIEGIQEDTATAATAMEKITSIISEINASSQSIVAMIEELSQTSTDIAQCMAQSSGAASRIASNVAESARGLEDVEQDVRRVSQSAERTAGEARKIASSSQSLAELSTDLGKIVAQFKV